MTFLILPGEDKSTMIPNVITANTVVALTHNSVPCRLPELFIYTSSSIRTTLAHRLEFCARTSQGSSSYLAKKTAFQPPSFRAFLASLIAHKTDRKSVV